LESADLWQGESGPNPESVSRWLKKFNGEFRVQRYSSDIIFTKIRSVFQRCVGKCLVSQCWRILQQIFRSTSRCIWLTKFN